ncbi:site-specific DNA-methyltransferase [Sphingomonas edaphi]|uniref:site-specific DNA-methyltransferase (adenine-specific) n=1 Tax=Sphingomonas edaphi TaxID=2315689 RepID=A0A418Q2R1_9SPHN|nr:site-specific DNA-methyltransferase [Sphingomonas edaphi]RIX32189.1 site-specific DNA-methyltransferase [Sphingomonas edaphi]
MPELQFKGKEFVYNHHLTVPFRPLEMHADKGIGEARLDGNLIVHGDNLHALKALLPMYAGKVDCIFIDPPYNTGNEGWAYNDNVNSPMIREWLDSNPIGLEDGLRHDKWACMMWPRLKLLHELLAETGSFWMTLDNNEFHNARGILDEIFGAQNFIATIAWQNKVSPANDAKFFSDDFDFLICYAKNSDHFTISGLERSEGQTSYFTNPDNDPRGPWNSATYTCNKSSSERPALYYPIVNPNTGEEVWPSESAVWRFSRDRHEALAADNKLYWGANGRAERPRLKLFLSEAGDVTPRSVWSYKEVGHTQGAMMALTAIMGAGAFPTPKPVELIGRILRIAANSPESLILDSFAGSGTTAHAVLAANARDSGNRRFILVEGEDYADTLTAERVRRVVNGYSFTGTQREELLREPLTYSKLRNAGALLERVQSIETLDGPNFERIAKTVRDGALIVTGERPVQESTPGLGGEFTYCTLGEPIEMDAILSGSALPDEAAMAGLLWHTATATPLAPDAMTEAPDIADGVARLGEFAGRTYWLIYRPDLDWLKSADAALSLTRARAIAATAPGNHLVFAPAKFVSRELLSRERLDVDYAPLPFALYRLETA